MTFDLNRRTLLKGAAFTGLGALAMGALEDAATAATLQGSLPRKVDVLVVGGGLSGLVAALKVARSGRSVLVTGSADDCSTTISSPAA
jgi:monoamine oxidase